jgi:hypothetical protein
MGKSTISMTILGMMVIPARNWTSASHLAGFSKLPMGEWKIGKLEKTTSSHIYMENVMLEKNKHHLND